MFDLNLAHIDGPERERDLAADLRSRRMLAATAEETAVEPSPVKRPSSNRTPPARVRALGR